MKAKYACEVCGKIWDTEKEARACEEKHEEAKNRESLKKKSEEAIASLIEKHVKTFGELPTIVLSDECQKTITDGFGSFFLDFLNELTDAFRG